tara:strand:+ start:976 stop:1683 length:708 start_codon:yes stop_codon:yes gene_type:complete
MFSPDAFSGSYYGGAPSVSAGYDGFDADQISQNIAMAQALAGAPTTGIAAAAQQAEANAMAQQQEAINLANAQEFDALRDAEAGRLHADSLTGVPLAGGVTIMRNAAGRPMGPQTIAANLPFGAGTLAQQIMTQNTLVQPDDGFGFSGPLSTGSLDSQPNFDNPDMDLVNVPSQEEMAAAQPAQAQTPGVAGVPQAFGAPGPYEEYRAQIGLGGFNTDPVEEHNARLMRAALGAR